jgi:hypothetical protein
MPTRKIAVNIAKLPTLLRGDYCLAAGNQKCRVTLIGHRRAKSCSCCAAQQSFLFRFDQDQSGQRRTPRIYYNAAPPITERFARQRLS